ncbi:putative defense protein 1 [Pollicipes pollicipes]|uniref:putative defense protein 1 n=1 Tax=Pollicipes pollicipes TaxID=41117 RepID=UPI00188545D1|nr:putative defense protein 1 [Pollicipes pollicipes]XP_037093211.1 putative defense protein 1 [Pollicipes pollicipes]
MLRPLLLLAGCLAPIVAFPNGAPTEACLRGMVPNHGGQRTQDLRSMPFSVTRQSYQGGVRVTIKAPGKNYFKGFMVQARDPSTGKAATGQGSWQPVDNVNLMNECAALTHADRSEKESVSVTWTGRQDVTMHATVLQAYNRFWADVPVLDAGGGGQTAAASPLQQSFAALQPGVVTNRPANSPQFGPVVDQSRFDPQRYFLQ